MNSINVRCVYGLLFVFIITGCGFKQDNQVNLQPQGQSVVAEEKVTQAELGATRALSPDFMCYNVNSTQVADWQDESFLAAVDDLSPSTLRIPGGDVGNYWDWQRGGLIENIASLPDGLPFFLRFKARQYTASKLGDFKTGLDATNTEAIFVLNMLTSDLASQLEMLRQAENLGIKIKHVELGNEFYFNIPNYKKTFPNPRAYGLEAKKWTEAVKQEFPEAKIAVVGVVPPPEKPARLQNWNKVMRGTVLPAADGITLHIYHGHGLNTQGSQADSYPYFQDEDVATILGEPFRNWQQLLDDANYQAIPEDKQIWITEYNLFEDIFQDGSDKPIPRVAGSWTHGLYNLATSLLFLEEHRIESICNHSLSEGSIFGAILNTSDSFVNPADSTMTAIPMSLSATGSALSLLGKATKGMNAATPIKFNHAVQLKGKNNFEYPAIYGWQFSNNTDKQAVIVNLSSQTQEIDLSNIFDAVNYQQLSGSPQDLVNDSSVLTTTNKAAESIIVLPAYSATKIY